MYFSSTLLNLKLLHGLIFKIILTIFLSFNSRFLYSNNVQIYNLCLYLSIFNEKWISICNLPVWMYVCFFMSLFWWNRFPQKPQGYGRVSLCISRCVDNVLERLKAFPHCLHSNTFSTLCTALSLEENIQIRLLKCN